MHILHIKYQHITYFTRVLCVIGTTVDIKGIITNKIL